MKKEGGQGEVGGKKIRDEVMFKVFAPRALEPILMCFDRDTKIGEIADEARKRFEYEEGTYTLQNDDDEIFDRNKTLKEEKVKCGDHLELVSTGGGVFIIPHQTSVAFAEQEILGLRKLCDRKGIELVWDSASLTLKLTLIQKISKEKFFLRGSLTDYPALPPIWEFTDSNWNTAGNKSYKPKPESTKFGASIFHGQAVLCVPFNRLAYQEKGGPHNDWGGCSNWKSVSGDMVKAKTLGDMIAVVLRDFAVTNGRMS